MTRLAGSDLTVGYADRRVLEGVDVVIPDASFTVIIGPNACGKSTLLRTLARLLTPESGTVLLDGQRITRYPSREVAKRLGMLPQTSVAPDGISVADLVARGRSPHQGMLSRWSREDERIVEESLNATEMTHLRDRAVDELSGGQRQRAWIAMALAQDTPLMLLDEPTTFLDIAHQIEVLDLLQRLREQGRTVVAVLHEINLASRYASHLIAMKDGRIVAEGHPSDILDEELVRTVFDLPSRILADPDTGLPIVIPRARGRRP